LHVEVEEPRLPVAEKLSLRTSQAARAVVLRSIAVSAKSEEMVP